MNRSYVYIMSNPDNNAYYTGVTTDIKKRVLEHKNKQGGVFTATYNCVKLVYVEEYSDIKTAIAREKTLKNWRRLWKEALIDESNSDRIDLSDEWY